MLWPQRMRQKPGSAADWTATAAATASRAKLIGCLQYHACNPRLILLENIKVTPSLSCLKEIPETARKLILLQEKCIPMHFERLHLERFSPC